MSQVEGMERLCSKFLREWLGVPPILYRSQPVKQDLQASRDVNLTIRFNSDSWGHNLFQNRFLIQTILDTKN